MLVSIGEAANIAGVSISTLRRWEREDKLIPDLRTMGGHRRYNIYSLKNIFYPCDEQTSERDTVCYARVSSHDQKEDLGRQKERLKKHCEKNEIIPTIISDLGSGLNYKKRGPKLLIEKICSGRVKTLILTHKDRLLRFGSELIFSLCRSFNTEVIILNESVSKSFEEELVGDVLEIMTVFTSKIYGKRSHQNRKAA